MSPSAAGPASAVNPAATVNPAVAVNPAPAASGTQTAAEPTVGWYPSTPAPYNLGANTYGAPSPYASAGPLAAAGGTGRGGLGRRSGLGRRGGTGRGRLVNVALFGIAPLALAGIVVLAFVLSSGRGQVAKHTGFQAGAAPSVAQQQPEGTGSTTASAPSAAASHGKAHPGKRSATPGDNVPSVQPVAGNPAGSKTGSRSKPKSSPHPKPKPAAPITPHNLGAPNFDGYCQHIGWGSAVMTASNAYGWHCSSNPSLVFSMQGACAWTFGVSLGTVINVSTDYYSPNSWQCWRTNGVLGQLNIPAYCNDAGLGAAKLTAANAYGWSCTGQSAVDTDAACQFVFHNGNAFSRFAVFADPYSWQCWR